MSGVFGFGDSLKEMEKLARNVKKADKVIDDYATKMSNDAKAILAAKGRVNTGAAQSGIQIDKKGSGRDVGWVERPNFHGYFHEVGFHALDNRQKGQKARRRGKKRQRSYRGVKATYVAPTPHMRPAFDKHEAGFYRDMQRKLTE